MQQSYRYHEKPFFNPVKKKCANNMKFFARLNLAYTDNF